MIVMMMMSMMTSIVDIFRGRFCPLGGLLRSRGDRHGAVNSPAPLAFPAAERNAVRWDLPPGDDSIV